MFPVPKTIASYWHAFAAQDMVDRELMNSVDNQRDDLTLFNISPKIIDKI